MAQSRELAFLLGAGAVKDVDLPTAIELTRKVEDRVETEYRALLPALRFVTGAIHFGRGCRGEPPQRPIDIEELLTAFMLLGSREQLEVYPFVASWHERVDALHPLPDEIPVETTTRDSFQFLAEMSRRSLREWLDIGDVSRVKYLRSFQDFVSAGSKLRIFTLNYDECIERALSDSFGAQNGRWTTGFDEKGWNPSLLERDDFDAYLFKLHGSLDWVSDPKVGLCSTRWPAAQESEGISREDESLLIFGTQDKLRPVDPFLSLLYHFKQALARANVLVIVGYGFGDRHVNDMIAEALQHDTQMRCIVVNPEPLDHLIPKSSQLGRMVGVEQRFWSLRLTAKKAFDSDAILHEVDRVGSTQDEEAPF